MSGVRFLHTADWQLGMTRHFLEGEAQARYNDDRLAAVRMIGRLAAEHRCAFVLVCGDVFESNQLGTKTIVRALDAMADIPVPVYLLPGNHDPLDAASVYRRDAFTSRCPPNVHPLTEAGLRVLQPGVELVAAPWPSKHPLGDLVAQACAGLGAAPPGTVRIVAGHGSLDTLNPDRDDPATIAAAPLRQAIADGVIHYTALGDRHSRTDAGILGRVWYSGTPEVTDYDEIDPGHVLVVDLDTARCEVTAHRVGSWRFIAHDARLDGPGDIAELSDWLGSLPGKERTVVKLTLTGALTLADRLQLEEVLHEREHLFAAIEQWERRSHLAVLPDDGSLGDFGLTGFAAGAFAELRDAAAAPGEQAQTALAALSVLYRLSGAGSNR